MQIQTSPCRSREGPRDPIRGDLFDPESRRLLSVGQEEILWLRAGLQIPFRLEARSARADALTRHGTTPPH